MQADLLGDGNRRIYTVSELNREVRAQLEGHFARVWLEGEVSNLSRPASGHLYFSLKDAAAQVRCAFFRGAQRGLGFELDNGQQVVVFARLSLYEARGEYQLIVEQVEERGSGLLRRQFEALKQRLHTEGLFDPGAKRALPPLPATLGVVTSPSAAALRDVLRVIERRAPWLRVIVFPTRVQGAGAGAELAAAVRRADAAGLCDVLLLVRGGGSLEDLWAFNDEGLARAIQACATPLISGVGHEIDFTIADFVADQRAATPSAAAELATPDARELRETLAALLARLARCTGVQQSRRAERLAALRQRLRGRHPVSRLQQHAQRRDELELRLGAAIGRRLQSASASVRHARATLQSNHPLRRLPLLRARTERAGERLAARVQRRLEQAAAQLRASTRALDSVSPLATLARGYAIITAPGAPATPIVSAAQVDPGDLIAARLSRGTLHCRVEERRDNDDKDGD